MNHSLTRRRMLASTGLAAAGLALGATGTAAQSLSCSDVYVGTWGGDYQDLLIANFEKRVLGARKVAVSHDVGNAPPRKTKLLTERTGRRGTMDVALLSETDMYEVYKQGVFEELDFSKLKNAANIIPALRRTYSIPHIYSGKIILYNPNRVNPAPTSYADLWDPKYKGRVGFADGLYIQIIESAAVINGGSPSNLEPGKAKLAELKKLDPKVYPSNEALAAALKSEEVWLTIMWRARGVQWKNAGIPVAPAVPKEGATPIVFEAAIPKNAPNKDCAYAYLDAMLDPEGQVGFAAKMGYVPTVTNAKLDPKLEADLSFTAEEQKKFIIPDLEHVAKNNAALLDWWNREFKG
jgi:putative spermidine/putrescine transport system substrate-binding protein